MLLRVAQTPSSALGSVRRKPTPEDCKAIFEILARRNIRYFFYIGGNDSAETANIIAQEAERQGYDMCCFHIPKTIDNDLLCNDHTPGYGSAGRFVACAVRGDDLDNRALGGVKIDVIMGRNAGFLTAAAALAKQDEDDGPHLVYVPERPFTVDRFVADVAQCMETYGRCVVAVSEGIRGPDGKAIAESFSTETDAHGNVQLTSGALGENLAAVIRERLKIKRVRADTFGFIQRCFVGITSETDAAEARQAGEEAVKAATSGEHRSGTITINRQPGEAYQVVYAVAPLASVAKHTRELPAEYINEAGNNVTDAFVAYARPIVGELPVTARFVQLKGRS
jgi:6-phosphofructokinase 1